MTFRVVDSLHQLGATAGHPPSPGLVAMLGRLRESVTGSSPSWSRPPSGVLEVTDSADGHAPELGFLTEALLELEGEAGRPLRVLDVGRGALPLCNWLSHRGHRVSAVDPDVRLLRYLARAGVNSLHRSSVAYSAGRVEQLPFPANSFDVVTLASLLHLLPPGNDRLALWEIARVLHPSGHLVLSFQVSPDPGIVLTRQPGQAYSRATVAWLLRQVSAAYVTSSKDLPLELTKLDRDELRAALPSAFAEGTVGDPRESFLLGGVLRRQQATVTVPPERRLSVLLAGQDQMAAALAAGDRHAQTERAQLTHPVAGGANAEASAPEADAALHELSLEERARVLEIERRRFADIAEARFKVIRRQEQTLEAYRRRYWKERLRRLVAPKIGTLQQHDPIALQIPEAYVRTASLPAYPVISIVTPSFNQGQFVERTLKSVLDQRYPGLEYVVQDGGSVDETLDILNRHRDALAHVESKRDRGLSHALNEGFRRTTGEIMAYLNSDDLLLPGALRYLANFFLKHPDVDVVYGHRVVIDENDGEIGRWILPPHDDDILLWVDYIPQETLFWRRRIWDKVGGAIDEEFNFAVDWELLLRFRQAGARFRRLPRFLGAFRVHPHQKTSSEMDDVGFREMTRLRERYHHRPVPLSEVRDRQRAYLRKHVLLHKLYRLGLLRY